MRFAVIGSRGYPSTYGGFETFVRALVPYAVADGHEVVVYGREGAPAEPAADRRRRRMRAHPGPRQQAPLDA